MMNHFRPDWSRVLDYMVGVGARLITTGAIAIAIIITILMVFK
jgi:hypothetical protein